MGQVHAYMLKALYEGLDINNRLFVSIKFVSSYDVCHNSFSIAKHALFFVPELILPEKNEAFPKYAIFNTLLHRLFLYWIS